MNGENDSARRAESLAAHISKHTLGSVWETLKLDLNWLFTACWLYGTLFFRNIQVHNFTILYKIRVVLYS